MANFTVTPNMGLNNPTPGIDPGPDYADNIEGALDIIDQHTHTGAANSDGLQIPSAGLNINADLSIQSNNLTSLRSTRYTNQSAVLAGVGDVGCVYEKGGDLWYNNSAGTPVQLTAGGAVVSNSANSYNLLNITNNHTINNTDTTVVFEANSTSNTILLSLPAISGVAPGRFFMVKDVLGTSQTHAITVAKNGSDTIDGGGNYVIADNKMSIAFVSDGISNWSIFVYDRKIYHAGENFSWNNGATIHVNGAVTFDSTLSVAGTGTFLGALNSASFETGTALFDDAVEMDGALTVTSGGIHDLSTLDVTLLATLSGGTTSTQYTLISPVVETRIQLFNPCFLQNVTAGANGNLALATHANDALADFNLNLPNGVLFTSAALFVQPGAHASLPGVPISFSVQAIDTSNLSLSQVLIVSFTDPTTPAAAYSVYHSFSGTVVAGGHVVNRSKYQYVFKAVGEGGANAINAGILNNISCTWTRSAGSKIGED